MERRVGVRPKGPSYTSAARLLPVSAGCAALSPPSGLRRHAGANPDGGGQFSQRPRLCGGLSRQMLLNHGFSAAAGSVCRFFTAAASANRLFAKTAFVRPLHRGCFYTPVFHSGRLRAPVLHRTWVLYAGLSAVPAQPVRFGRGDKRKRCSPRGCTVSCIGVAEASLRHKQVTGGSVLRRSTDSLFCCD